MSGISERVKSEKRASQVDYNEDKSSDEEFFETPRAPPKKKKDSQGRRSESVAPTPKRAERGESPDSPATSAPNAPSTSAASASTPRPRPRPASTISTPVMAKQLPSSIDSTPTSSRSGRTGGFAAETKKVHAAMLEALSGGNERQNRETTFNLEFVKCSSGSSGSAESLWKVRIERRPSTENDQEEYVLGIRRIMEKLNTSCLRYTTSEFKKQDQHSYNPKDVIEVHGTFRGFRNVMYSYIDNCLIRQLIYNRNQKIIDTANMMLNELDPEEENWDSELDWYTKEKKMDLKIALSCLLQRGPKRVQERPARERKEQAPQIRLQAANPQNSQLPGTSKSSEPVQDLPDDSAPGPSNPGPSNPSNIIDESFAYLAPSRKNNDVEDNVVEEQNVASQPTSVMNSDSSSDDEAVSAESPRSFDLEYEARSRPVSPMNVDHAIPEQPTTASVSGPSSPNLDNRASNRPESSMDVNPGVSDAVEEPTAPSVSGACSPNLDNTATSRPESPMDVNPEVSDVAEKPTTPSVSVEGSPNLDNRAPSRSESPMEVGPAVPNVVEEPTASSVSGASSPNLDNRATSRPESPMDVNPEVPDVVEEPTAPAVPDVPVPSPEEEVAQPLVQAEADEERVPEADLHPAMQALIEEGKLIAWKNGHDFIDDVNEQSKIHWIRSKDGLEMTVVEQLYIKKMGNFIDLNQDFEMIDSMQDSEIVLLHTLLKSFLENSETRSHNCLFLAFVKEKEIAEERDESKPGFTIPKIFQENSILHQLKEALEKKIQKVKELNERTSNQLRKDLKEVTDTLADLQQKFIILSMKGASANLDFGGARSMYHVKEGRMVVFLAKRTLENIQMFENFDAGDQEEDQFEQCIRLEVKKGETVLIPAEYMHYLRTPEDSTILGSCFLLNHQLELYFEALKMKKACIPNGYHTFHGFQNVIWAYIAIISFRIPDSKINKVISTSKCLLKNFEPQKEDYQWYTMVQKENLLKELGRALTKRENAV